MFGYVLKLGATSMFCGWDPRSGKPIWTENFMSMRSVAVYNIEEARNTRNHLRVSKIEATIHPLTTGEPVL